MKIKDLEKAFRYFVIAIPEDEEQINAYFYARKGILTLLSTTREQELEAENKELKERIVNWRKYMAPTREQVEKAWKGECDCTKIKACCTCCAMKCQYCIGQSEYKQASFCMKCGRPLTNEAMEMVMERLEVLMEAKEK